MEKTVKNEITFEAAKAFATEIFGKISAAAKKHQQHLSALAEIREEIAQAEARRDECYKGGDMSGFNSAMGQLRAANEKLEKAAKKTSVTDQKIAELRKAREEFSGMVSAFRRHIENERKKIHAMEFQHQELSHHVTQLICLINKLAE